MSTESPDRQQQKVREFMSLLPLRPGRPIPWEQP